MAAHLTLVRPDPAQTAWEKYRALCLEAKAKPMLRVDRRHCEALCEAHEELVVAFRGNG